MRSILLIFFLIHLGTVHSQTWIGNFTVDAGCDTTQCCCMANTIQIFQQTSTTISFTAGLSGAACMQMTSVSQSAAIPSGYSISISISGITLTITLSSDSNSIRITNQLLTNCIISATRANSAGSTTVRASTSPTQSVTVRPGNTAARQYLSITIIFNLIFFSFIKFF